MISLKQNHVLQAVIIPTAIGTLLYSLKSVCTHIFKAHITPRLYSNITIHSTEVEYFDAVLDFIQDHSLLKANHFIACKPKGGEQKNDTLADIHYQQADTLVSMRYKKHLIYVSRKSGETLTVGCERQMVKMESLSLSVFGTDSTIIKSLISDAIGRVNQNKAGCVRVFVRTDGWSGGWVCALSKKPRSFDSVVLDKSLSHQLLNDARAFLGAAQWYEEMGIPHRRGYLLHGPPGCGKTSFCQALAGALHLDICMLSLSSRGLDDCTLAALIRDAPLRSIVMLEDVDVVFIHRDGESRLTFSGLLNAIDGVVSQEGRILIMTTNHIENLDPALVRPGRCDVKVMVDKASSEQLVAMFLRFFPHNTGEAHRFASRLPARALSLAQIQGHLLEHRTSAENAVETALLLSA